MYIKIISILVKTGISNFVDLFSIGLQYKLEIRIQDKRKACCDEYPLPIIVDEES